MIKFLTESATFLLVGIEAFMLGFGAVWMVLSALLTFNGWLTPALVAGAVAAIASTFVMIRLARRSTAAESALMDASVSD